MKRDRRVVITGLGVVSASGFGIKEFWKNIKNGSSSVSRITSFDTSAYPLNIAAEIKDFNPRKYFDEKTVNRTAKFAQYALVAAKQAMRDAKLTRKVYNSERLGVSIGTSMGGLDYAFDQHDIFLKEGYWGMDTYNTSIINFGSAGRAISMAFKANGACQAFTSTCVASADAIGHGLNAIRKGNEDIIIAGGAEAPISPVIVAGFYLGRILSNSNDNPIKVPRPFDLKRAGTVVGEGAAILILEELNHAIKRGAKIYAEIIGYASTCDAYHLVIPHPKGEQGIRAIRLALKDAGIKPSQVDYINAHGTGTVRNDIIETQIIKKVFGKRAFKIPISATKSMTGHLLGGAGSIEALISVLTIKNGMIPPTINYEFTDPHCDLDYVPNQGRKGDVNFAISNSFGFGGFNTVLVFGKYNK